jgi:hypothetical protein
MTKKLLAIFMAIVMALGCTVMAGAEESNAVLTMDDYAETATAGYVANSDLDIDGSKISQCYAVSGSDANIYIVTDESNNHIGILNVNNADAFQSTFAVGNIAVIDTVITEEIPVAFSISDTGALIMHYEDATYNFATGEIAINQTDTITKESVQLSTVEVTQVRKTRAADENANCNVPIKTAGARGECWGTCLASVIQYRTGTTLTSTNVYDALLNAYGGTPQGTNTWYQRAYSLYGISYTAANSMSYSSVRSALLNGRPIICSIRPTSATSNGHAIVLKSARKTYNVPESYTGSYIYYYYFMDPQYMSGYVMMQVDPNNSTSSISYVAPGQSTYTYWLSSRY